MLLPPTKKLLNAPTEVFTSKSKNGQLFRYCDNPDNTHNASGYYKKQFGLVCYDRSVWNYSLLKMLITVTQESIGCIILLCPKKFLFLIFSAFFFILYNLFLCLQNSRRGYNTRIPTWFRILEAC